MKKTIALIGFVVILVSGCANMDGPRPPKKTWKISQQDVNAMADCQAQAPNVKGIWDPLTGYYAYKGKDAEKNRQCLKTKYGWFELGPPEFTKGTMAPPQSFFP